MERNYFDQLMENNSRKLTLSSNKECSSYMLKNQNGLAIELLSSGASIKSIRVPYKPNETRNIALTFQNNSDYANNSLYLGATLGPTAGRIKNATLPILDKHFLLDANDGNNHLHGGSHNVSFQNWNIQSYQDDKDCSSVVFDIFLPDQLDGYPGNRTIKATYRLGNDNKLYVLYEATSDQATYFNLSNHVYFNLFGDPKRALEQTLFINSNQYITSDAQHLPVVISSTKKSGFAFSSPKVIREQLKSFSNEQQLVHGKGFNHSFILNEENSSPRASIRNTVDDIGVNIYSDSKCIHFYSGGFINHDYILESNMKTQPSCGIALEPQDVPAVQSPPELNYLITSPNKTYTRSICYEFFWKGSRL